MLVVILFVAITLWWVLTDVRDVNNDNARHLLIASTWSEHVGRGDILGPFRGWVGYPPAVHLARRAAQLPLVSVEPAEPHAVRAADALLPGRRRVVRCGGCAGLGVGGTQNIVTSKAIPGNPIGEYIATVYRDTGYFEGPPVRTHAPFVELLDDLHDELGVRRAVPHQPDFSKRPFSLVGTTVLVKGSKLELEGFTSAFVHDRRDAWIVRMKTSNAGRPPCVVTPNNDGTGLYVYLGRIPADHRKVKPDCP